jgi:hypothetical protein
MPVDTAGLPPYWPSAVITTRVSGTVHHEPVRPGRAESRHGTIVLTSTSKPIACLLVVVIAEWPARPGLLEREANPRESTDAPHEDDQGPGRHRGPEA